MKFTRWSETERWFILGQTYRFRVISGGLAEWPIALALETSERCLYHRSVSSNLTPAANVFAPVEVGASIGALPRTAKLHECGNSIIRLCGADFHTKGVRHE